MAFFGSTFSVDIGLFGLAPRTSRWFDQRALYHGTYAEDRLPWLPSHGPEGEYILSAERNPIVKVGLAEAAVDRVVNMTTGQGKLPALAYMPLIDPEQELSEAQEETVARLRALLYDDLKLETALEHPIFDAAVGGTAAIGITRRILKDGSPAYETERMMPEFCYTVLASQNMTLRARYLAQQLLGELEFNGTGSEVIEANIAFDTQGPYFIAPEEFTSETPIYIRYQKRSPDIAELPGSYLAAATYWQRTDYLLNTLVHFKPIVRQAAISGFPPQWVLDGAPSPHNWGVIPVSWVRHGRYEVEEQDGTPLLTHAVRRQAEAADYAASFAHDSVLRHADPTLLVIDGVDANKEQRVLSAVNLGAPMKQAYQMPMAGGATVMVRTQGTAGQQATVRLLETTGTASKSALGYITELRRYMAKATSIVDHDPSLVSGMPSGVALERASAPTVELISRYRLTLSKTIRNLLEIGQTILKADKQIVAEINTAEFDLKFSPVFARTAEDVKQQADALAIAISAGLLSQHTAATLFANFLDLAAPEKEADIAVKEKEEKDAEQESLANKQGGPTDPMSPADQRGQGQPADAPTPTKSPEQD